MVLWAALAGGCSPEVTLVVDLVSDLRPGIEVVELRLELRDALGRTVATQRTPLSSDQPLLPRRRVGELAGLTPDRYTLRGELIGADGVTFATWINTTTARAILLGAGETDSDQSFLWLGDSGSLFLQHGTIDGPSHSSGITPGVDDEGTWKHLVVVMDLAAEAPEQRVRFWVDGIRQPTGPGMAGHYPTELPGFFLGGPHRHALGNKWQGAFDWIGRLAETYLIWGEALDPTYFSVGRGAEARSITYRGPITAGSLYFDYVNPGENRFDGQPGWNVTNVMSDASSLPYAP